MPNWLKNVVWGAGALVVLMFVGVPLATTFTCNVWGKWCNVSVYRDIGTASYNGYAPGHAGVPPFQGMVLNSGPQVPRGQAAMPHSSGQQRQSNNWWVQHTRTVKVEQVPGHWDEVGSCDAHGQTRYFTVQDGRQMRCRPR